MWFSQELDQMMLLLKKTMHGREKMYIVYKYIVYMYITVTYCFNEVHGPFFLSVLISSLCIPVSSFLPTLALESSKR